MHPAFSAKLSAHRCVFLDAGCEMGLATFCTFFKRRDNSSQFITCMPSDPLKLWFLLTSDMCCTDAAVIKTPCRRFEPGLNLNGYGNTSWCPTLRQKFLQKSPGQHEYPTIHGSTVYPWLSKDVACNCSFHSHLCANILGPHCNLKPSSKVFWQAAPKANPKTSQRLT